MLDLLKIAVTGGLASGKSSVCKIFEELGAFVVYTDEIVHEQLTPDTDLGKEIQTLLGIQVNFDSKDFRKAIAEKVFNNSGLLEKIEKLIHPIVLEKITKLYHEASKKGYYSAFVVEIPLVFEIHEERFYDAIITVLTTPENAHRRWEKAGFNRTEYDKRMNRQMNPEKKAHHSTFVIHNNGSLEELKKQVIVINQTLQNN